MILMNDFRAESKELSDSMLLAAERVIRSGWFILGKELQNFESEWAKKCGVSNAIGVGNGMDAIEIALRSLEIGPGDEVITTPMSAFATVLAIHRAGATPVLADIESETALLSIDSVKRCISKKTKAIILVHLYGQLSDMNKWVDFCNTENIFLIEDCAQAHLANSKKKFAGSFGIAGAYSFYPTKNLSALGDAGALITNDKMIASKAIKLRNYGQNERYFHSDLGMNSRLDEIQAAILLERLKWLDKFTKRRKEIAYIYNKEISNSNITLLKEPMTEESHVYHLFVVTCSERDLLQKHLEANDIQSLIHYPIPFHLQDPCLSINRDPNGLRVSEDHSRKCLSLPCHPQMSEEDISIVIDTVNSFKTA